MDERIFQVSEIFQSIQGESSYAGLPCSFIRLSGCDLRCRWCDTVYAFENGETMTLETILETVAGFRHRLVEVTGGEPLIQPDTPSLLKTLCDQGYTVLLETAGHLPFGHLDSRVIRIVDVKCPGSGMADRNQPENYQVLNERDEVKFVLANREDYDFARKVLKEWRFGGCETFYFSPVTGEMELHQLAKWMLEDRLQVRLQLQLHKIIWPDQNRGV